MASIELKQMIKRYGKGPGANQVIQKWFVKGLVDTEK